MNITDKQRAAWVKALRSGKYVQGNGYLKAETDEGLRYCCLGVLLETCNIQPVAVSHGLSLYSHGSSSSLPPEFENGWGRFFDPLTYDIRSLADINDRGYLSFNDIAKIVETCQFVEG